MCYTPEEMEAIENVIEIFQSYLVNEPRIDVVLSQKFGYLLLVCAKGEDERIIKIEAHDDLVWRLFWELSLAVRNLELDGEQISPELYPSEVKEMRRRVADMLDRSTQSTELTGEIRELLESFLALYPYGIFA